MIFHHTSNHNGAMTIMAVKADAVVLGFSKEFRDVVSEVHLMGAPRKDFVISIGLKDAISLIDAGVEIWSHANPEYEG